MKRKERFFEKRYTDGGWFRKWHLHLLPHIDLHHQRIEAVDGEPASTYTELCIGWMLWQFRCLWLEIEEDKA